MNSEENRRANKHEWLLSSSKRVECRKIKASKIMQTLTLPRWLYISISSLIFLTLFYILGLSPIIALAQDITPPNLAITSTDISPNGTRFDFLLNLSASDDQEVSGLQYRARVNGKPFSNWLSYPYIPGLPLYFTVNCNFFAVEIRAVDSSNNLSKVAKKEFKRPFKGAPGTPLSNGFVLGTPPNILENGKARIVLMKKFAIPKKLPPALEPTPTASIFSRSISSKKKASVSVVYEVTVTNLISKEVIRKTSKRNILALKNLPAGGYSATYKASLIRAKKILANSTQSPEARFTVN